MQTNAPLFGVAFSTSNCVFQPGSTQCYQTFWFVWVFLNERKGAAASYPGNTRSFQVSTPNDCHWACERSSEADSLLEGAFQYNVQNKHPQSQFVIFCMKFFLMFPFRMILSKLCNVCAPLHSLAAVEENCGVSNSFPQKVLQGFRPYFFLFSLYSYPQE